MSFWGLSQSGKDSRGALGESAKWNTQQYRDNLNRAGTAWDQGQSRSGQMYEYWQNRMGQGLGSPGDVRAAGQQAMPGVDQAVQNRWKRWADMQGQLGNWQSQYGAPNVTGQIYDALNNQAGNIGRHYDMQQSEIQDTANRLMGRNESTSRGVTDLINNTFDSAGVNFNNSYNDLINQVYGVYGKLQADSDRAHGTMLTDAERLRPGSEAFMARTARSYAPMMANTMARLRRSGIDPNTVQAGNVLSQAEAERARGIDDAAAAGDESYIASRRGILGAQLGANMAIGQGMNDRTTGLGTTQAGVNRDMTLGRGEALSSEQLRAMGLANLIDSQRNEATMGNNASAYADAQGWYDRQANAGLMGRNLALQDLGLNFDLAQGMNQEELIGPGLSLDQFNAGLNYQNMQAGAQDRAAGYGTGMGQQDYANWVAANNIARGYGNDAFQQNMTNLGVQSANAGWGRNMIAGAAGGLANAFVPGSGQFVSSAISGGGQASPYNFGQFNYGPTAQQQAVMNLPAPPSWMYPQYSTPGSLPPYRP